MKFQFLVLLTFFTSLSNAQNYLTEFDLYNIRQDYDWRGLEDRFTSQPTKDNFIKYALEHELMVNELAIMKANNLFMSNYLKAIDINNDNLLDIIFSGPSGGEPNIIKIFVNTGNKFNLAFSGYQGIVKVTWENDRIDKIYLHDWGCCAEIRLINSVYKANFNEESIPSFSKIYQSVELRDMTKPKQLLENPIRFSISNDGYKLRFRPEIDDENTFFPDGVTERPGNTIGFLNEGYEGTAYGLSTDETGRIWWYVEIDEKFKIEENILYTKDLNPTKVIGWLSSRYVSKIK